MSEVRVISGLGINARAFIKMVNSEAGQRRTIWGGSVVKCLAARVEELEEFVKNGVEFGYIKVPDRGDPARGIIDDLLPNPTESDPLDREATVTTRSVTDG